MNNFLSCDWGTSTIRLKLVERVSGRTLAAWSGTEGVQKVFQQWQAGGGGDRFTFFQGILQRYIQQLAEQLDRSLQGYPIVLSGMASSSIGMRELPYAELPLGLDGAGLVTATFPATDEFPHDLLLISGARKADDVMRGEEVQAIGWRHGRNDVPARCLLLLPGTHSKHLYIEDDRIVDFRTYMTGELYALLQTHSILGNSIDPDAPWNDAARQQFVAGLRDAATANLSHLLFTIRARSLAGTLAPAHAGHYLSGLLIGQEFLQAIEMPIILAATEKFSDLYQLALETINPSGQTVVLPPEEVEELATWGQMRVVGL